MKTSNHSAWTRWVAALAMVGLTGWLVSRIVGFGGSGAGIPAGLFWPMLVAECFMVARFGLFALIASGSSARQERAGQEQAAQAPAAGGAHPGVAVIVTNQDDQVVRTALISAIAGVGADRVVLVGASEVDRCTASELAVDWIVSDGTWFGGVTAALTDMTIAGHQFLALTSASSALVPSSLDQIPFDTDCAWVQTQTIAPESRSVNQHLHQIRLAPTLDRWRAMPWMGEGSIVRVAAFQELAEARGDLASPSAVTISLQQRGWHGRAGSQPLVIPHGDRSIAVTQRESSLATASRLRNLRTRRSPLWAPGLSMRQRIVHLSGLLDDLAGTVTFIVMATVAISVALGRFALPVNQMILTVALPTYLVTMAARYQLSGGLLRPGSLANQNADQIGVSLSAVVRSVAPIRLVGRADLSQDTRTGRRAVIHRSAAALLAITLEVALVGRAISSVFGVGLPAQNKATNLVSLATGFVALIPVLISLRIIVRTRTLRVSRRTPTVVPVALDGQAAWLYDMSSRGLGVNAILPAEVGSTTTVAIFADAASESGMSASEPVQVRARVARCHQLSNGEFAVGLTIIEPTPSPAYDRFVTLWAATASAAAVKQLDAPRLQRHVGASRLPVQGGGNRVVRVLTAFTMIAVGSANLPPYNNASAAPVPVPGQFTITKSAPSTVLYGSAADYTVDACNGLSSARFNLSVRDVLPAGATYVAGSGTPSPSRVIVNQPASGQTTLLWENIHDVQVNSCFSVSYRVSHNATGNDNDLLHVGDTITNAATGYVNSDPRFVPKFDSNGKPLAKATNNYTESANAATKSKIVPVVVTKDEPSPESELMRGVHSHSTVYTLVVTNNSIKATNGAVVDDWLPAGLEFLGCGTADNTPDGAVEYPGAPRLDDSTPDLTQDCLKPGLVETVQSDPDGSGPMPFAVYTHVQWKIGDLAPQGITTIRYRAGIPNRENVLFPDKTPTSGVQGANLSNNSGKLTTEPAGELSYTNWAAVTGTYTGTIVGGLPATQQWSSATETVVSEDLAIQKGACNDTQSNPQNPGSGSGCLNGVTYGGITTWTLAIHTSEYRSSSALAVTDFLGDGLEFVQGSAVISDGNATSNSIAPAVSLPGDGTQKLVWDFTALLNDSPISAVMGVDANYVITYQSTTLSSYRFTKAPVLSFDRLTNNVSIAGTSTVVRGDDLTGDLKIQDVSAASIASSWSTIDKVTLAGDAALAAPGKLGCAEGVVPGASDVTPRFSPNDIVCYSLYISFPKGIRVQDALLTDFLPPNSTYVGYAPYTDSSVGHERLVTPVSASVGTSIVWKFGVDPAAVPRFTSDKGDVFHVVLATKVTDDPDINNNYDLTQNLFKATSSATNGAAVSLRDLDSFRTIEPELGLVKGVIDIKRGSPSTSLAGYPRTAPASGNDSHGVVQDDLVTYRVQVPNVAPQIAQVAEPTKARVDAKGRQQGDAINVEIWDVLPATLSCAALEPLSIASNLTRSLVLRSGGLALAAAPSPVVSALICDPVTNRISMTVDKIPAGYLFQFDYVIRVSKALAAGTSHTNTAGVRKYDDIGGGTLYYPKSNIDPTVKSNAPVASDPSTVSLPSAAVSKTRSTSIAESGNSKASQATIGETINYSVTVTVPAMTSLFDAVVTDSIPATLRYVAGSVKVTASPLTPPSFGLTGEPQGFDLFESPTVNGWTLNFPQDAGGYRNATTKDQKFILTFDATVLDVSDNVHGSSITNIAKLTWKDQDNGKAVANLEGKTSTTVVEPLPTITKSHTPDGSFIGGQTVTYTVTIGNTLGRPPLHDVSVTDCVPVGLATIVPTAMTTPDSVKVGEPGSCADGGSKIVWTLPSIESKGLLDTSSLALTYTAIVANPPSADQTLINRVFVGGSSIAGKNADERTTYVAKAQDQIRIAKPTITKVVKPQVRTPGQVSDYTVSVAIPANVRLYDATLIDTLPSNLSLVQASVSAPSIGDGCKVDGPAGHPIAQVGNRLGWFVGDIVSGNGGCVVTVTYQAWVRSAAVSGDSLTNVVALYWNLTDKVKDNEDLGSDKFDRQIDAKATVAVVEPNLTIVKTVDDVDGIVDGGQLVGYTVTVTNGGTSPAFDIAVVDAIPDGLLAPTLTGGTCIGSSNGAFGTDPSATITWALFGGEIGLDPKASCTLTYTQTVDKSTNLTDGQAMKNTATITEYFGDPDRKGPGSEDFKQYGPVSDSATITHFKPTLTIVKTTGNGTDVDQAIIGQPFTWIVTVTNSSPVDPKGARTAFGVDVVDTLPANWDYDATTSITGQLGCTADPITADVGAVQSVSWTDLCDLAAGQSIQITFTAIPSAGAAADPGLVDADGNKIAHVNTALVGASDRGGDPLPTQQDTANATLKSVDLQIIKTDASDNDDGTPDSAGFVVDVDGKYFINVANNGPDAETGPIVVTDTLPSGLTFKSFVGDGWNCTSGDSIAITCVHQGPLASGDKLPTIEIVVNVGLAALNIDATTGLVKNSASVAGNVTDRNPINNTDSEPTPVKRIPDFTIDKSVDPSTSFVPGQPLQYLIVVTNLGPSSATGPVTVTDPLPGGLRLTAVSGDGWDCSASIVGTGFTASPETNGGVNCVRTVTNLPKGTVLPTITVVVATDPSIVTLVNNIARVAHPDDNNPSNDTNDADVNPQPQATLTIVKDDGGATFTVGQIDGQYSVVVTNQGPSTEVGPIVVTDTAPVGLKLLATTSPSSAWNCVTVMGTGFVGATTGSFTCTYSAPVLPGTILPTITAVVEVGANAVTDPRPAALNTVTNIATVRGTTDPTARTDDETTPVVPSTVLTIDKSHDAETTPWEVGGLGAFQLVVGNTGPSGEYGPVTITDRLPVGLTFDSTTGNGWVCSQLTGPQDGPNGTVSCTYDRPADLGESTVLLAVGQSLPPVTLLVRVGADAAPLQLPQSNVVVNTATVNGTTDPGPRTDSDEVPIIPIVDLQIVKTHESESFKVGQNGIYQLTVTNNGPSVASAPIIVSDTLPTGLGFVSAEGTGWDCSAVGQQVTCTNNSALPVESQATIALTVSVGAQAVVPGQLLINTASVSGPDRDPDLSNNKDPDEVPVIPAVDLSIDKSHTGDFEVGQLGTFDLVVTNNGPNDHGDSTITVVDTLPTGLSFAAVRGDGWTCANAAAQVVCTHPGPLASGASLPTIQIDVSVEPAAEAGVTNTATVSSPERDPKPENNVDNDPVKVIPITNLTIVKTVLGPLVVGGLGTWRLVVTNEGPSAAVNVVILDDMPAPMTVEGVDTTQATCSTAGQRVSCTIALMPAESIATIDIRVKLVSFPPGGTVTNTATVSSDTKERTLEDNTSPVTVTVTNVSVLPPAGGGGGGGVTLPTTGAAVMGIIGAATAFVLAGLLLIGTRRRRILD